MNNLSDMKLTDEEFERIVRAVNLGDNKTDNERRAKALGLGGRGILVAPGAVIRIHEPGKIEENVFIGLYSYINGKVTIGKNTLIGPRCSLAAGNHKFNPETQSFSSRTEQDYDNSILIGEGCWLASNVTVTAGVKMGKANLICAGAVVTHDTEDYAIMAGIPAKKVGWVDSSTGEYHWNNQT